MKIEDQVITIFAGVNGFLDKINVNEILNFEKALLNYIYNISVIFKFLNFFLEKKKFLLCLINSFLLINKN
jgi:F0F1-type ATP synthase alpha subunit